MTWGENAHQRQVCCPPQCDQNTLSVQQEERAQEKACSYCSVRVRWAADMSDQHVAHANAHGKLAATCMQAAATFKPQIACLSRKI